MSFQCGLETVVVDDLKLLLDDASASNFDFVIVPLENDKNLRATADGEDPFTSMFADFSFILTSSDWSNMLAGRVSSSLEFDDVPAAVTTESEKNLTKQLDWAEHLSLPSVVFPAPSPKRKVQYFQQIASHLQRHANASYWVRMPPYSDEAEMWQLWNMCRQMCDSSPNLGILLDIGPNLPPEAWMERWLSEPIRCISYSTDCFLTNKNGYPVLSQAHQSMFRKLSDHKVQFVVCGELTSTVEHMNNYRIYLEQLVTTKPPMTPLEEFEHPFLDYVQVPLQPLADNLECQMYETFEKDPVKYAKYEEAIEWALKDYKELRGPDVPITLMVVGAGRGPLMSAALRSAERVKVNMKPFAIEKNPNAVYILRLMKRTNPSWKDVTIVHTDMREWETEERADILVSELLGSWGDNELSPECLDGAQRLLKEDGVSIPYSYTSFAAPVSSQKMFNEIGNFKMPEYYSSIHVVKMQNYAQLAPTQAVFKFTHPTPEVKEDNSHNVRMVTLSYISKFDSIVHGFIGEFEAILYKDVMISIHQPTFSEGMFSWFPVFIPIRTPVVVKKGDRIDTHFWRRSSKSNVWYEWTITSPTAIPIHNLNGKAHSVGLLT